MPFLGGRGQASRGYFGAATTPGAPTVGTATPGDGQISVTFTAPAFDGGLPITTYQYALSTDSYATWTTRSTGTTASPLVITGLSNGTSYSIKIRAVNSLGGGIASDATTAVIPFGAADAPTSLVSTPGDGQLSVAFTPPAFNGGRTITTYQYALSTDSYATWTNRATGTTASPLVITGLSNGTSYGVKLRAVTVDFGAGTASAAATAAIPFGAAIATTTAGSDQTTTPSATTTNAPSALQTFGTLVTFERLAGQGGSPWTNPYPAGATDGTGTLNGSAGTTHFVWGTSSGSYPNEVAATSNAYVRTTWPRGTSVYYKAKIINTSCVARFNGTVNSNGSSTVVTFEYGTSSGVYPSSVSAGTVTALTATAVTADVSLAAGTYYFRTKGVNAQGTPQYGIEQSVTISAKSATAASEQSFTPPTVGTLYELVCAGGGAGPNSGSGGGGGAVSYYSSAAAPTSLAYTVGGGGGADTVGGNSFIIFTGGAGISMSATGGALATFPGYDIGGSSGVASGGTANYPSTAYAGGQGGNIGDSDYGSGGGGGAGGSGGGYQVFENQSQIYAYGGNGGPAVTVNGNTFGAGGGGWGVDEKSGGGGPSIGTTPASDYGRGGFRDQAYNANAGTGGLVRFKYYGP